MAVTALPSPTVHLLHIDALAIAAPGEAEPTGVDQRSGGYEVEIIRVSATEVRRGRAHAFRALARRLESPACGGLRPGGVEVVFPGRPADGTPVYLQREVRAYARRLGAVCAPWFYLFSPQSEGLLALTLARLESVRTVQVRHRPGVALAFDRQEFQELFLDQSRLMRPLFTRAGLGRAAYHRRLTEISRRFGLMGSGDWAEPA